MIESPNRSGGGGEGKALLAHILEIQGRDQYIKTLLCPGFQIL